MPDLFSILPAFVFPLLTFVQIFVFFKIIQVTLRAVREEHSGKKKKAAEEEQTAEAQTSSAADLSGTARAEGAEPQGRQTAAGTTVETAAGITAGTVAETAGTAATAAERGLQSEGKATDGEASARPLETSPVCLPAQADIYSFPEGEGGTEPEPQIYVPGMPTGSKAAGFSTWENEDPYVYASQRLRYPEVAGGTDDENAPLPDQQAFDAVVMQEDRSYRDYHPMPNRTMVDVARELLASNDQENLRKAIVWSEILRPPLALRRD